MQVLDSDYDNYMIGYQCYENIQFALEKDVEPVHIITVGIATRNPDLSEAEIAKFEEIAIEKVPGFTREQIARVQSGIAGKCDYKLKA